MLNLKKATKEHHHSVEFSEFAELLISGNITPEVYHLYLTAQERRYEALESAVELPEEIKNQLFRTGLIRKDIIALEDEFDIGYEMPKIKAVDDYVAYIESISNQNHKLLAHVYVQHFGDLHGGQIIKKHVPGEGNMHQFENRKELIASVRELLSDDMAPEAQTCFKFSEMLFEEIMEIVEDVDKFGKDDPGEDYWYSSDLWAEN